MIFTVFILLLTLQRSRGQTSCIWLMARAQSVILGFPDRRLIPVAWLATATATAKATATDTEWRNKQTTFLQGWVNSTEAGLQSFFCKRELKESGPTQLLPAAAQKPNQVSSPEQQWWWRPVSSPTQHTWSPLAPPCHSWMNIYTFVNNLFNDCIQELLKKEILKQFSSQTEMKRLSINDL